MTSLEIKVGEVFEVNGLTLPLVGETSLLVPKISYSEEGLKLLNFSINSGNEGVSYEKIYVFEAVSRGNYNINLYFSEVNSEEKWVPQKDSSFYGKHEKMVDVKVS